MRQCDNAMRGMMIDHLPSYGNKLIYKDDWGIMMGRMDVGMDLLGESEELINILCLQ